MNSLLPFIFLSLVACKGTPSSTLDGGAKLPAKFVPTEEDPYPCVDPESVCAILAQKGCDFGNDSACRRAIAPMTARGCTTLVHARSVLEIESFGVSCGP
jgi:hypothetical protein